DPGDCARGRGAGQEAQPQVAAAARDGGRADQPRSVAVVPQGGRRRPLPDRRHLVADRDRRHPDHAAAGSHRPEAGSATLPFFGVEPTVVDDKGAVLEGATTGNLCLSRPWPGIMRGVYGDPDRFRKTYFSTFPGRYFTGDGCRRDEDGYYWITGRVDDVI